MKTFKCLLLLLLVIVKVNTVNAQDQAKPFTAGEIKKMADDKKFMFKAKAATPDNSASRNGGLISTVPTKLTRVTLTTDYSVLMTPDSIASYLPYFGKMNSDGQSATSVLNMTLDENPVKFSTQTFDYVVKQKKKGDVVITVKPKSEKDVEKYVFEFTLNGTAKLELTTPDNKTIFYDGVVIAL